MNGYWTHRLSGVLLILNPVGVEEALASDLYRKKKTSAKKQKSN